MAMIEFEDHDKESQEALLAYLDQQRSKGAVSKPRPGSSASGLLMRFRRLLRSVWAAAFPRCGR